ncbi:hypothetical protein [Salinibacter altiplanensis]|uniref:hypothetical protein n=1 Tax=Salinibacter altiplanensis TaxID=1803181 RepID=UPI000C9FD7E2|nr:hypothetical protein [Salinibacter altiplanensis]
MPDILTSDTFDEWLDDDVQSEAGLERTVDRAEQKVIGRYRERERGSAHALRETTQEVTVQLVGWEETADGTPDIGAMPGDLVERLRDCIARIVTRWVESPGGDVRSKSVGSRSVTYDKDADALPHSVYAPLRPYDDRTPYSPGV